MCGFVLTSSSNGNPMLLCNSCGSSTNNVKRCTSCRVAQFCGKHCQARSWKDEDHKELCPVFAEELTNHIHDSPGQYLRLIVKDLVQNNDGSALQSGLMAISDHFHFPDVSVTFGDLAAARLAEIGQNSSGEFAVSNTNGDKSVHGFESSKLTSALVCLLACNANAVNADTILKVLGRHAIGGKCERGSDSDSCEACRLRDWLCRAEDSAEEEEELIQKTQNNLQSSISAAITDVESNPYGVAILCVLYDCDALIAQGQHNGNNNNNCKAGRSSLEHSFVFVISPKSVGDTERQGRRLSKEGITVEKSNYEVFLYQSYGHPGESMGFTLDDYVSVMQPEALDPQQLKDFLETYGRLVKEKMWGKRAKELYKKLFHVLPEIPLGSKMLLYTHAECFAFTKESVVIMRQNLLF